MNTKLTKVGLGLAGIVLVLASLIYFLNPFPTAIESGHDAKSQADINAISTGLENYKDLNGFFPSTSQGLAALAAKPSGDPVPKNWLPCMWQIPLDSWGKAYQYKLPGEHNPKGFDLYTTGGPRGRIIGNW